MSYLKRIVSKLKKEEVVIFAGAGMSLYAGFPTGNTIAEKIISEMDDEEQKQLKEDKTLPNVANVFVKKRANTKSDLISILKIFFKKEITDCHIHKILNDIPYLNTIITTNYDELFETALVNKIFKITKNIQLPELNNEKDKIKLFKIHGDLENPDKLIITKSDYDNFLKEIESNLIWNEIKAIIQKSSILFIGYTLGDINVIKTLSNILNILGSFSHEYFFINPDKEQNKIIEKKFKCITCIDSTAEKLLPQIRDEIKLNLFEDIKNNKIASPKAIQFLKNDGIFLDIQHNPNGSTDIGSISDKPNTNNLQEFIKNKIFLEKIFDTKLDNIKKYSSISHRDLKKSFQFYLDDIDLKKESFDKNGILPISIPVDKIRNDKTFIKNYIIPQEKCSPEAKYILSHHLDDDFIGSFCDNKNNIYFENVTFKFYGDEKIHFAHNLFYGLLIKNKNAEFKLQYVIKNKIESNAFLKFFSFVNSVDFKEIRIFRTKKEYRQLKIEKFDDKIKDTITILNDFFFKLSKIESLINMKFDIQNDISKKDIETTNKLYDILVNNYLAIENDLKILGEYSKIKKYLEDKNLNFTIVLVKDMKSRNIKTFEVFKQKIKLNFRLIQIKDAYFKNFKEIKEKVKLNENKINCVIASRSKKANVNYNII